MSIPSYLPYTTLGSVEAYLKDKHSSLFVRRVVGEEEKHFLIDSSSVPGRRHLHREVGGGHQGLQADGHRGLCLQGPKLVKLFFRRHRPGAVFTTLHFIHNLGTGPIS
jgi:hypothetical protein